jgi:hypothetical protein
MIIHSTTPAEIRQAVGALNSLLHGERSAVETYEMAIAKFVGEAPEELSECLRSHLDRVDRLVIRIHDLGGEAAMSSGLWGTFAKVIGIGSAAFGRKAIIAALEEGEEHGLHLYDDNLDALDPESRRLVEGQLLTEQRVSHAMLSALRDRLQTPRDQ